MFVILFDSRAVAISSPSAAAAFVGPFDRDRITRNTTKAIKHNAAMPPPIAPPMIAVGSDDSSIRLSLAASVALSATVPQPSAESVTIKQSSPIVAVQWPAALALLAHHLQPRVSKQAPQVTLSQLPAIDEAEGEDENEDEDVDDDGLEFVEFVEFVLELGLLPVTVVVGGLIVIVPDVVGVVVGVVVVDVVVVDVVVVVNLVVVRSDMGKSL
jgi:hypothetical protein